MRKSREEKARSREEILSAAARLFRERGIATTSVSDVMTAAGLTHGGFYRHFDSKEALVASAIEKAFGAGLRVFTEHPPNPSDETRAYVDQYLSDAHLADPGDGCPILHLGPEAARGPLVWREALDEGADRAIAMLARGLPGGRDAAIRLLTCLIGAMTLARALPEGPSRNLVLDQARRTAEWLLAGGN
jgi:TetR/AcrR family transcriptional repressor of nem operon